MRPKFPPEGDTGARRRFRSGLWCAILKQWVTQNPSFKYTISSRLKLTISMQWATENFRFNAEESGVLSFD